MIFVFILLPLLLGEAKKYLVRDCHLLADQFTESPNKSSLKHHRNFQLLPHGKCGHRKFSPMNSLKKVFRGTEVTKYEYPWVAKLNLYGDRYGQTHCGGAIISDRYILTAAHCCKLVVNPRNATWFLGSEYLYFSDRTITSHRLFIHNDNSKCVSDEVQKHDVCLVRLSEKIEFKDNIQPICVPIQLDFDEGIKMEIAGFGLSDPEAGTNPVILQKKTVTVVGQNECREKYSAVDAREICTTYGSCFGDSGGPLMKAVTEEGKETYWIFGITSYGDGICPVGGLSVYMRVTEYAEWILDHLEP